MSVVGFIASVGRVWGVYVLYISAMGAVALFCVEAGSQLTRKLVGLGSKSVASRPLSRVEQRVVDLAASGPRAAPAPLVAMIRPNMHPAVLAAKMDRVETAAVPVVVAEVAAQTVVVSRAAVDEAHAGVTMAPATPPLTGPRVAGYAAVQMDVTIEALTAREVCGADDCLSAGQAVRGAASSKTAGGGQKARAAGKLPGRTSRRPLSIRGSAIAFAKAEALAAKYNVRKVKLALRTADTPGELVRRSLAGLS